jgi:hypothetical protein
MTYLHMWRHKNFQRHRNADGFSACLLTSTVYRGARFWHNCNSPALRRLSQGKLTFAYRGHTRDVFLSSVDTFDEHIYCTRTIK